MGVPIIAGMSMLPERMEQAARVVETIAPQVDALYIYCAPGLSRDQSATLDQWTADNPSLCVARVPDKDLDMGDSGKFYGHWQTQKPHIYLSLDDDLNYDPSYVEFMIKALQRYRHTAIVGLHGIILNQKVEHYYSDRKVYHGRKELNRDVPVNVLGTYSMAFHSDLLRLAPEDFPINNISDLWVAKAAQDLGIPMVCVAHEDGFVSKGHIDQRRTLNARWGRDKRYPGNEAIDMNNWDIHHVPSGMGIEPPNPEAYWMYRARRIAHRIKKAQWFAD